MPKKITREALRDACDYEGVSYQSSETIKQLQTKLKKHKMSKDLAKGIITEDQIEAWKKKYGKVHVLKVIVKKDDNNKVVDEAVGYLKQPARNHKATAMSMYAQHQILECGEFLRDNCWLGGDERLKSDKNIADTAAIQANGIIQFMDGSLGEA